MPGSSTCDRHSDGARVEPSCDAPERELDDRADREELRRRYYGLLQELRVVLPGVQVLVAFLLTIPFATRFGDLDRTGRLLYGIATTTGLLAIVAFLVPTAHHRFGPRTDRGRRLAVSIHSTRLGLALLAATLVSSLTLVSRFIYGPTTAWLLSALVGAAIAVMWAVIPRLPHRPPPRRTGR